MTSVHSFQINKKVGKYDSSSSSSSDSSNFSDSDEENEIMTDVRQVPLDSMHNIIIGKKRAHSELPPHASNMAKHKAKRKRKSVNQMNIQPSITLPVVYTITLAINL